MRHVVYICLTLLLVSILGTGFGCANSITQSENSEAQEFAGAFIEYALEVKLAEDIATERLNKASDLLTTGKINTIELRKRYFQITLIHAYTLEYIDSKPEYEILWPFLYGKEEPPSLAWCIPELEKDAEAIEAKYESYLEDYIGLHDYALAQAVKKIGPPKSK